MLFLYIFRFSEEKLHCWISVVNLNSLSSEPPFNTCYSLSAEKSAAEL